MGEAPWELRAQLQGATARGRAPSFGLPHPAWIIGLKWMCLLKRTFSKNFSLPLSSSHLPSSLSLIPTSFPSFLSLIPTFPLSPSLHFKVSVEILNSLSSSQLCIPNVLSALCLLFYNTQAILSCVKTSLPPWYQGGSNRRPRGTLSQCT